MTSLGTALSTRGGFQYLRYCRYYGVNNLKIRRKKMLYRQLHFTSHRPNLSVINKSKHSYTGMSFGAAFVSVALVVGYDGVCDSERFGECTFSGNSSSKLRSQNWKEKYGARAVCLEFELESLNFAPLNVHITKLRDSTVGRKDFVMHVERLMGQLAEVALSRLQTEITTVYSPTGGKYTGIQLINCPVAAVSVLRSGDAMLPAFVKADPNIATGKLLITRLKSKSPELLYSKLPVNLSKHEHQILLLDPMLASGNTMLIALEELIEENNVKPENIQVVSIFGCEEGVQKLLSKYPGIRILFVSCDERDPDTGLLVPGVGSFGDRYFGSAS